MSRRLSLDIGSVATFSNVRRSSRSHKGSQPVDTLQDAHMQIKEFHNSLQKNSPQRDPNNGEEDLKQFDGLVAKDSFRKHNVTFHKLFEDIPETEALTATFTCSLQKELIYHGRVFVSADHICFHASVLLKDVKVVLAVSSVCNVKRHKAPVPMLSIYTVDGAKCNLMYVKHSKTCFELLKSVCLHMEKENGNTSPQVSSAENGGNNNGMVSGHSSVDESVNSRNNSISLESESERASAALTGVEGGNTPTEQDSVLWNEDADLSSSQGVNDETVSSPTKGNDRALDFVFYIFGVLFLLLMLLYCYIGLRVMALEEQLTALWDLSF